MNNTIRISGLSAVLAAMAVSAGAQTVVFSNDGGQKQLGVGTRGASTYSQGFGQGVGFTNNTAIPNPYYSTFNNVENASTAATAAAIYQPFTFTGSTTTGPVSIAVHGNAFADPAGVGIVTVYANIYANTGSASAPTFGTRVLTDVAIPFTSNLNDRSDFLYTSTTTATLTSALTSGGNYVISFNPRSTGGSTVANAAVVDLVQAGPATVYGFSSVDADATNTTPSFFAAQGPIGFRIISSAVAAPEPGQFLTFGLGALGLGLAAIKRRRSA